MLAESSLLTTNHYNFESQIIANSNTITQCGGDQPSKLPDSSNNIIYKSLLNDFYSFEDPNTKWILTVLSSANGIKRLQRHWKAKSKLLRSYFEIPDNPDMYPRIRCNALSKIQNPAFHSLISLYLNPLGISIYTQNEDALKFLLSYNINKISDPVFIQKWWNKGDDKYITDFTATNLINLMLRRNYFTSLPFLMVSGYNPMDRIYQIDHIQSTEDSKSKSYQDSLDLALHLLNDLPGLNIGRFFQIISSRKHQTRFNAISYDFDTLACSIDNKTCQLYRLRSIFRLLLIQAINVNQEKFFSKYLTVLKTIQRLGYFRYINKEILNNYNEINSKQSYDGDVKLKWENLNKQKLHYVCESHFNNANELECERLNLVELNKKVTKNLSFKLLLQDRQIILMILFSLLNEFEQKGKSLQNLEISELLVNILLDNNQLKWLINSDINKEIIPSINFDCCKVIPKSVLTLIDIENIKYQLINSIKLSKKLTNRIMNLDEKFFAQLMSTKQQNDKKLTIEIKDDKELKNSKKKKDVFVKTPFMLLNGKSIRNWNRSKQNQQTVLNVNPTSNLNPSLVSLRQKIVEIKQKEDEEKYLEERKQLRNKRINNKTEKKVKISQKPTKKPQKPSKTSRKPVIYNKSNFKSNSMSVINVSTKLYPPPLVVRTSCRPDSSVKTELSIVDLDTSIVRNYVNKSGENTTNTMMNEPNKNNRSYSEVNTNTEMINTEEEDNIDDDDGDDVNEVHQVTSCDITRMISQRVQSIKKRV